MLQDTRLQPGAALLDQGKDRIEPCLRMSESMCEESRLQHRQIVILTRQFSEPG